MSFVGNLLLFAAVKNFANRSRIDKVVAIVRVAPLFWLTVYSAAAKDTAKHRAKFGWPLLTDVGAVTKTRCDTALKFAGVPQTPASISAVSEPTFTILPEHVEEILLFNKFFRLSTRAITCWCAVKKLLTHTHALCEDTARQSCAMVRSRWRFFMVALWNKSDHYSFALWFLLLSSSFVFSSPNLSRRRLDVCHTST